MSLPRALGLAMLLSAAASTARADVVSSCPPWEVGYDGHGASCSPNYLALGCGGLVCGGAILGALVLLGVRGRGAPRTRGD
jgi:hypothetical protein